jgi:branched-subunit amino acid aminotransferase/4-amino-4-deoxychorismate lyase
MNHWWLSLDGSTPSLRRIEQTGEPFPEALLYGYSVYTTLRHPARPEVLRLHLERLAANAKVLDLSLPERFEDLVWHALNGVPEGVIRLTLWPEGEGFQTIIHPQEQLLVRRALISRRPAPVRPALLPPAEVGLHLEVLPTPKLHPTLKHGSLLDAMLARRFRAEGVDDAVWCNEKGELTEATTSNLFFLAGSTLLTACPESTGCLPGVSRLRVLERARLLGLRVEERGVSVKRLTRMDGAFLTNASLGVRPVRQLGETIFPWPAPISVILKELADDLWQWLVPVVSSASP